MGIGAWGVGIPIPIPDPSGWLCRFELRDLGGDRPLVHVNPAVEGGAVDEDHLVGAQVPEHVGGGAELDALGRGDAAL